MAETLSLRMEAAQAIGQALEFSKATQKAGADLEKLQGALGRFSKIGGGGSGGLFVPEALAAEKLAAAQGKAAVAGEGHRLALGRISNALEALSVEAVGANSKLGSIATKFLEFGVGGVVTAGVLAGLAAITFAWEKLTEESRKQREEQEKSTKSLIDYYRELDAGGKKAVELADSIANLAEKQKKVREQSGFAFVDPETGAALAKGGASGQQQKDISEQERDIARRQTEITEAIRQTGMARDRDIASQGIELEKLRALNDAHGKSELALELINIRYDAMAQKLANAQGHTEAQTAALNKMTDALTAQKIRAAELADATKQAAFATEFYQNRIDGLLASLKKMDAHDFISGRLNIPEVLRQNDRTIAGFKPKVANLGVPDDDAIKKAQKFADDLQRIFERGWADITSDGLRSWSRFFDSVAQMAVRLRARMRDEGETDSFRFKALGIGAAGLAGGLTGFGVGQQLGSSGTGALGGAAAGAAVGAAFGAPGALVGALAGLAGGFLGGAKAARERAEAEKQLQEQLTASIAQIKAQVGAISALDASLAASHQQFEALRKQTEDALSGRKNEAERNRTLAELNTIEAQRTAQLKEESDFLRLTFDENQQVRQLRAQGRDEEADALAAHIADQERLNEAIKQFGKDSAQVAEEIATQGLEAKKREDDKKAADAQRAADKAIAQQDAQNDDAIRMLRAQGHSDEADALALQFEQEKRFREYQKQGFDDATMAALKLADAAEQAALAAAQAERRMNDWLTNIGQQGDVFGLSPLDQFSGEAQAFGFAGLTRDEVRALFKRFDPNNPLTDAEKQMNANIDRFLRDWDNIDRQTAGPQRLDAGAEGASVDASTVHRSMSSTTVKQADRMIDEMTTQRILQREMVRLLKMIAGNTSALSDFGPTANKALGREYDSANAYAGSALVS